LAELLRRFGGADQRTLPFLEDAPMCAESQINRILLLRNLVYITYMDDSGSTGRNLADKNSPFQIVGAIIIKDEQFDIAEWLLADIIERTVPEELRSSFEFHASHLWARNKPFESLTPEQAESAIKQSLEIVQGLEIPVVYGAVDKSKLSQQIYSSASPLEMAFRACLEHVEDWMRTSAPNELAILIADESDNKVKHEMKNAFRQYRRKVRSLQHNRGKLGHLVDDMFFGASADSLGIQLADVCNFVIERHLCEKQDTEHLYQIIKDCIFRAKTFPE
jgi:hypothetical protein